MCKKVLLVLLAFSSLLMFSSCDTIKDIINDVGSSGGKRGLFMSEEARADARMEQIGSAIRDRDAEALKSLFSEKALGKAVDIENEIERLFEIIQGDIVSWEIEDGWASSGSIEYGKKSMMIRFGLDIKTDKEVYEFFVIDYNPDTINPDNEGIYMLEYKIDPENGWGGAWQDRMRPGIYIH